MTAIDHRATATADKPAQDGPRSSVPDLIGLRLEEACEVAAWSGIKLNATSSGGLHGRLGLVLAQSPPPGSSMESLRQIHVVVSAPNPGGSSGA